MHIRVLLNLHILSYSPSADGPLVVQYFLALEIDAQI